MALTYMQKFLFSLLVIAQLVLPVSGYSMSLLQQEAESKSVVMKHDCHQAKEVSAKKHSCCDSQDVFQGHCNNQCDSCNMVLTSHGYAPVQLNTEIAGFGPAIFELSEILIPSGKLPSLLPRPPQ